MRDIYKELSEERKIGQENGTIPDWYTTAGYQLVKEKYIYKVDTVKEQYERIAKVAAKHLVGTKYENQAESKFFELFWKGWLSPSTPVLSNMGTDRGMPVSCSGSTIHDSVDGFYSGRREVALLTKNSFGTASYLGDIRPRGSKISNGGKASGVVPVFKGFVQDMRDIVQGTRRGSWAGYLEIDHGDFDELSDYIMAEPDDANVGWIITDNFISKLNSGDVDSIRRYQKVMKLKMTLGKGYFFFVDKANRNRPKMYVDNNKFIKNSQLCLTGDTLITISDEAGQIIKTDIRNFVDNLSNTGKFKVWSYNVETQLGEWKEITDFAMTNPDAELMEIEDEETGKVIRCTPEHNIFTKNRGYIMAKDLIESDELVIG